MKRLVLYVLIGCVFIFVSRSLAQNDEDMYLSSEGIVAKVTDKRITLREFDYQFSGDDIIEKETQVVYEIDKKTKFVNAKSVKDVLAGSSVEIQYIENEKNNKKIVKTVTVMPYEPEEDTENDNEPSDYDVDLSTVPPAQIILDNTQYYEIQKTTEVK